MSPKRAVFRAKARRDVVEAHDRYVTEGGMPLGLRFLNDVEATIRRLEAFPVIGSTRYADIPDVHDNRHILLSEFPYLIFYMILDDRLDVMRVLHQKRDIPEELSAD
jgi:toxin ParE1/3/4